MSNTQVNSRLLELLNDLLKQFKSSESAPRKEAVWSVADYLQESGFSGDAKRLLIEYDNRIDAIAKLFLLEYPDKKLGQPLYSGPPANVLKAIIADKDSVIAQLLRSLITCVEKLVTTPDAVGGHQKSDDGEEKPAKTKVGSPPKKTCNTAALQYWAIGLEDGENWWLFHKGRSGWEQHGKVDIPTGKPQKIAAILAENEGAITSNELAREFSDDYFGASLNETKRKLRSPLSRLRHALQVSIRVTGGFGEVSNPIPQDRNVTGWRSAIEIGYAVWDGDRECLVFKLKSEMSGD